MLTLVLTLVLLVLLVVVFCLVFGHHLRPMMLTCPVVPMPILVIMQKKLVTYPWWEIVSSQRRKSRLFVAGRSSPSWSLEVPWHVRNSPCQ